MGDGIGGGGAVNGGAVMGGGGDCTPNLHLI